MWKSPVHIVAVGTSYKVAPVEVRESLSRSVTTDSLRSDLDAKTNGEAFAVLSTCNRIEIYAAVSDPAFASAGIEDYFVRIDERSKGHLYSLVDDDAIEHLFSVACGIDSLLVGEPQILLQVKHANKISVGGASREVIERLFQRAYSAGKRIRREVGIETDASISSVAVQLVLSKVRSKPNLLLIGAGKMIRASIRAMNRDQFGEIYIASRSPHRVPPLDRKKVLPLEAIPSVLPLVDAVIVATSSPTFIVTKETLSAAIPSKKIVFVDISMPRNVDPKVSELTNIELYDIDDLALYTYVSVDEEQITKASGLIKDEVARFVSWLSTLEVAPVLRSIRTRAEEIRREELAEALRRLSGVREKDAEILSVLSSRIINRLLHEPTVRLRELAKNGGARDYGRVLKELLGISD